MTDPSRSRTRRFFSDWRHWLIGILCVIQVFTTLSEWKFGGYITSVQQEESKSATLTNTSNVDRDAAKLKARIKELELQVVNQNQKILNVSFTSEEESKTSTSTLAPTLPAADDNAVEAFPNRQNHQLERVPDWRIVTDCSIFNQDCAAAHLHRQRYDPYPFRFEEHHENDYNWTTLQEIPQEWKVDTPMTNFSTPFQSSDIYPPQVSDTEYDKCMTDATNLTYDMQLKNILSPEKTKRVDDMVAFTIADFKYAHDMIHEFFQMSWDLVGFKDSIFMVALDLETVQLACRYGYPVISAPSILIVLQGEDKNQDLRNTIQSTKFQVSRDLVFHDENFVFYEMDIWWLQNPLSHFEQVGKRGDGIVSVHQDNPFAPNIGVYAFVANNSTREFFQICLDLQIEFPEAHDQAIFTEVWNFAKDSPNARWPGDARKWPSKKPGKPQFQYPPIQPMYFDVLEFAAQEWPIVHEKTLAVHPLCHQPLMTPHGKKMIAKELGAWYGFQSQVQSTQSLGGYYQRTGEKRRYLMLDGRVNGGFSLNEAMNQQWAFYHNDQSMKWIIAVMVILARRTNRILILPKVMHDRSNAFLWTVLDIQSIEDIIDVRETNFPSNKKSWYSETEPFNTVARSALGISLDRGIQSWKMFGQSKDSIDIKSWNLKMDEGLPVELWFGLMMSEGYKDAELLLANPQFTHQLSPWSSPSVKSNTHPILSEINTLIQKKIKWCVGRGAEWNVLMEVWPAGRVRAIDDCYGRGGTRG